MPKQLQFDETHNKIIKALECNESIVIATFNKNKIAARTVYFVLLDSNIYFLTSKAYDKYKQIVKNQNVALCSDNIQIEGITEIIGHPMLEENKTILECFLAKHPENENNKRYVKQKNSVFIKVEINKISAWINGSREYIDPIKRTAYRIG